MSNSLAVATVTAALRSILNEALVGVPDGAVNNARVTTLRPDMLATADGDGRGINVFLYQVSGNASWGNAALPARRSDGTVIARPEQAIDLHYLLTFSGDEAALEPQRMLGAAVTALVTRPVLSRALLGELVARAVVADSGTWLQFSDLAEQVDLVRFTPLSLNLEELSKLWSTFIQSPYRLSVTYQACVVLLDGDVTPQPALPVLTRGIDAAALNVPVVTRVVADADPAGPIGPGTVLRIEGRQLRGTAVTRVRLDDVEVPVPENALSGTRITVALPAGTRAGVRSLQVVHPRVIGTPPVERGGAESEAAAVVVRPVVNGTPSVVLTGTVPVVTVPVNPAVGRTQRVLLSLNEHHPPPGRIGQAFTFVAAPPAPPAPGQPVPESATSVTVRAPGVPAGTYLVRVQVDGAQSVLAVGPDGRFDTPRVSVP